VYSKYYRILSGSYQEQNYLAMDRKSKNPVLSTRKGLGFLLKCRKIFKKQKRIPERSVWGFE